MWIQSGPTRTGKFRLLRGLTSISHVSVYLVCRARGLKQVDSLRLILESIQKMVCPNHCPNGGWSIHADAWSQIQTSEVC